MRTLILVFPGFCLGHPKTTSEKKKYPGQGSFQGCPFNRSCQKIWCLLCELAGRHVGEAVVVVSVTGRNYMISSFLAGTGVKARVTQRFGHEMQALEEWKQGTFCRVGLLPPVSPRLSAGDFSISKAGSGRGCKSSGMFSVVRT